MNSKKDIFATPEGKRDFTIALIVIAIFGVFIYQFLFNTTEEVAAQTPTESDIPQIEAAPITDEDEEQQYLYTNSKTYQATTIEVANAYESDVSTAVVISDIKNSTPIASDSITKSINEDNATILPSEVQKKGIDSIAITVLKETAPEASTPLEEEVIPETNTIEATETITNTPATTSTTLNCVVIIGVFKVASNKTAVIEKLKSLGYVHSDGILREGLTYVGVPVACENEQERKKLLNELNQAFGIATWVKKI